MLRLINTGLLLSFLVCYLEWGHDNSSFVFQVEYLVFFQKDHSANTFTHPLIIIPFLGQLLILFTIFQKKPGRRLTWIGLILLGILVLVILLVGLLSLNYKIILSTVPFILFSMLFIVKRQAYSKTIGNLQ
ncbi:MAG: hypothetical protein IPP15_22910 [Saprospiraceae bacterium]|uniref:Uncharacterized protein n=1 Tax=Candidatus Opimibacter skivensis TaxID=2982028 RepID=A0A9D7XTH7_9BACT|nr:hypothetical protein [Candidatus Opimibacter skivensis]MBK9985172.1 hypothetical protein [Candidatus Opimibacter skivensis]